ncbi:BCCT family transporter [Ornithinicoccus halotolerans]|uniref:BCCT family transporter n=1 Tax=Ornithinicoccus halotolerans TaxID=1748220 RepID=UPI001E4B2610|nr:BCCT family transporter [Ornithinicoccus halotolerans]
MRAQVGPVFYVSIALSVLFVLWGSLFTANLSEVFTGALNFVISSFGWLYMLAVTAFLAFTLFLACSRYGQIRLGKDSDRPEFSTVGWIAMLFAAGVGLSFLFWGVAEPASHFATPPFGMAEASSVDAAQLSMQYTFFHWGLHPWAVYAVLAMAIAYFNFRWDRGNLISATLYPLLGDRVDGPIGKVVDILGIVAVLFGVATALGLGALQLNGGLSYVFGVPVRDGVQLVIIAVLTVAFLISAATGLKRGIYYLSQLNMGLALVLALFILAVGPTAFLFDVFTQSLGQYLWELPRMSFFLSVWEDSTWAENWTLFYWAWWVSWAPFVGAFIARISKGRTIREFVFGVLIVPSIVSFLWFTIFGGSAIFLSLNGGANIAETAVDNLPKALFDTLAAFPLGEVTAVLALVLVTIFFITSADSATFVLGSMSTNGDPDPAGPIKIIWGVVVAMFASVLLLAGGLSALQTATITAAVPLVIVMIGVCVALMKALSSEVRAEPGPVGPASARPRAPVADPGPGAASREAHEESDRPPPTDQ